MENLGILLLPSCTSSLLLKLLSHIYMTSPRQTLSDGLTALSPVCNDHRGLHSIQTSICKIILRVLMSSQCVLTPTHPHIILYTPSLHLVIRTASRLVVCLIVLMWRSAASPVRLLLWGVRVGPPVVKGSPAGGFMTLVWRAESELVLRGERHAELRDAGSFRVFRAEGRLSLHHPTVRHGETTLTRLHTSPHLLQVLTGNWLLLLQIITSLVS